MKNIAWQKYLPYLVGIVIFFLVTVIYFNPLLTGKKINQHDIVSFKGASKEIADYREKTGNEALWTNSMFGGMPAYQISMTYPNNLLLPVDRLLQLYLPRPVGIVFLYFVGFFLLLLVLRVNPWLSIIGALAFGFSSYLFIILQAGHNTKAHAIAYMAPVFAGIILAYRGKYLWGAIITALFLGLEIRANHLQITYYLLLIVVIYGFFELVKTIKEKTYSHFAKATGILVLAALLGVLPNITNIWTTYEFSKETIRNKSELSRNKKDQTSGLDRTYVTRWSYGVGESFSLMIPNVKGGGTGYIMNNPSALKNVDPQFKQAVGQSNHYWGDQPGTSGPVYVGAIIIFLFVLGLFIIKGSMKWVLLIATALSIMLAMGHNFMSFTNFFLDYIPLYNKFRAVTMILVIAEFCIPLLAIIALAKVIEKPELLKLKVNLYALRIDAFYLSLLLTAGLALVFYLSPRSFFSFFSDAERGQFSQLLAGKNASQYQLYMNGIETARISIFRADVLRSFAFIVLAGLVLYLYQLKKIKSSLLIAGIGVLVFVDMVVIANRYLNKDHYVNKFRMERPFRASVADKEILKDKSLNYRVYNLTTDTYNESATSYYHQSVGGYHAAKLRRYSEIIEHHLVPEVQKLVTVLQKSSTAESVNNTLSELNVLNMLNTRYFIFDPKRAPLANAYAYGNAWFVNEVKIAQNADDEISILKDIKDKNSAVVDKKFSLSSSDYKMDSLASIKLSSYEPNHLKYEVNISAKQLAVFSEIYYDKGWNAYIDGEKISHIRANYILRAMEIPAGKHLVEFKFEPSSYYTGRTISLVSSIMLILVVIGMIGVEVKKSLFAKK